MKFRLNALPDERFICRSIPGLSKDQLELCYRDHDVTLVALEGLIMAAHECQAQVKLIIFLIFHQINNNLKELF